MKIDHITNNMMESFNSQLSAARSILILSLLEHVTKQVIRIMRTKYRKAKSWPTKLLPIIQRKLKKGFKMSRHIEVV